MSTAIDFPSVTAILDYLDDKALAPPSDVTVELERDAPAKPARPGAPTASPKRALVRAPCPGRVMTSLAVGPVREGDAIAKIECGRQIVVVAAPFSGDVTQWLSEGGQFVEFNQALAVLSDSPVQEPTQTGQHPSINTPRTKFAGKARDA